MFSRHAYRLSWLNVGYDYKQHLCECICVMLICSLCWIWDEIVCSICSSVLLQAVLVESWIWLLAGFLQVFLNQQLGQEQHLHHSCHGILSASLDWICKTVISRFVPLWLHECQIINHLDPCLHYQGLSKAMSKVLTIVLISNVTYFLIQLIIFVDGYTS